MKRLTDEQINEVMLLLDDIRLFYCSVLAEERTELRREVSRLIYANLGKKKKAKK